MNPRHLRPSIKEMQRQEATFMRKLRKAVEEAQEAERLAKEATSVEEVAGEETDMVR